MYIPCTGSPLMASIITVHNFAPLIEVSGSRASTWDYISRRQTNSIMAQLSLDEIRLLIKIYRGKKVYAAPGNIIFNTYSVSLRSALLKFERNSFIAYHSIQAVYVVTKDTQVLINKIKAATLYSPVKQ